MADSITKKISGRRVIRGYTGPGLAILLFCLLLHSALAAPSLETAQLQIAAMKRAEEKVSLLNLINGLNLEPAQLKALLSLALEARSERIKAAAQAEPLIKSVTSSLEDLSKDLIKVTDGTSDLAPPTASLKHQLKEMKEALEARMSALEQEARKILSPSQLEVLGTFKPCIVPPRDFRDPVRVGSTPSPAGQGYLKRVRKMNDRQFEKRRDKIIDKYIERIEKRHGRLTDQERQDQREKANLAMEKARNMTEADFRVSVNEILADLLPPQIREEEELKSAREKVQSRKNNLGSVGRWFLAESAPEVLQACLERYSH